MTSNSSVAATLLCLILALTLSTSIVQGQAPTPTPTAKLKGTVKDPSGAAMSSVDIAVIRDGKVLKAQKTDELGAFSLDIAPGQYQLAVAAPDFKPYGQT